MCMILCVWLHTQPFTHLDSLFRNVSVAGCGTASLLKSEHIPVWLHALWGKCLECQQICQLPSGYTHMPKIRLLFMFLVNILSIHSQSLREPPDLSPPLPSWCSSIFVLHLSLFLANGSIITRTKNLATCLKLWIPRFPRSLKAQ